MPSKNNFNFSKATERSLAQTEKIDKCRQTLQISQSDTTSEFLPDRIGQYSIEGIIGRGGAGIVYSATDKDAGKVALKVIQVNSSVSHSSIERFFIEAETAKKLRQHPNIITVYDSGCDGKNHYIAMELVPGGRTFDEFCLEPLPINKVLDYLIPIADALSYAHEQGILHRDIKPANVLINEFDQPLLSDFGIAKIENAPKFTMTGVIMGTPQYMSPEQCGFGDRIFSRQSDIYSFGVMLYELLTGKMPYPMKAETELSDIFKIISSHEVKSPRKYRKEISRNLEAVVLRTLEKEKALRYKDMRQLCSDLKACRDSKSVSVRKLSWSEQWEKWLRRNTRIALTAIVGIIAVITVYFGFALPKIQEKMHQKSKADVNAMAAKRKALILEKEIDVLKKTNKQADVFVGEGDLISLLLDTRKQLASGEFNEAEKNFIFLRKRATIESHKGLLIEASSSLGRIYMTRHNYTAAIENFNLVAKIAKKNTPLEQLALFEEAVALRFADKKEDSEKILSEIITKKEWETNEELDKFLPSSYLKFLSGLLLRGTALPNAEDKLEAFPRLFRGLAAWVFAELEDNGSEKEKLLNRAVQEKSIFIWIEKQKEEEK